MFLSDIIYRYLFILIYTYLVERLRFIENKVSKEVGLYRLIGRREFDSESVHSALSLNLTEANEVKVIF